MKAKKSYKRGGMMEPIIGMPKSKKLEKLKPIGPERSMQVEGIMSKMKAGAFSDSAKKLRAPGKSVAEVEKPRRKKRRRKFENGGKVTGAQTEKSRAGKSYVLREGKKLIEKREQEQLERSVRESRRAKRINESEARRAKARPDYRPKKKLEEGLRDDDGRILSANKLGRKDVTKLEMTSPKKEIKKSTAKIPVPAKKRRLRLRRRK